MNDGSYAVAKGGERNLVTADHSHASDGSEPDSALQIGGDAPTSVSYRLTAARKTLGLSIEEVASRTRVTLRHIAALEAGDYGAMPGRPYAIGFAKAYARAVGLSDIEITNAVRAELQGSAPRTEPRTLNQFEVGDPAKTPSRLVGWLALVLVGAILALGGVFWRSYYAPAVALPSLVREPEQSLAAAPTKTVPAPQAIATQAPANGAVIFTALEEGIWVKFYDGRGKQLMQKQLAKGESYTVPVDAFEPRVWTGRPDALAITIGGRPIPRLADAEKVMKDVPVDTASLRARSTLPPPSSGADATPNGRAAATGSDHL